ncbi:type II secretion system F family protein [Tissierella sp. MSJ-40]|uniref:Type II secretion system F family protein n=1 Tax=Tissierella simiarum TaxID=2841534 RepID=A0ABS6E3L6_9FIRM|nr:type II secretion system F family protein [Tissierella simiarum]MBU5437505.1 type II secretion system F family protein [Tissierella simiarum]
MIYKYKAVSENGQVLEGYFEAESQTDVLTMLKSNSYLPVYIEEDLNTDVKLDIFSKKVNKKDIAVFCRQFYTMINAGIGIVKSLDILEKQTENKTLKKGIAALYEDVQKGFTLSEAMKKHEKIFPSLLVNMVEAGEVSGSLDVIMERMAVHFEKENKLENKIKTALVYPVALSIVALAVVIFLLTVVMPTFINMFESSGLALPGPTQALLTISNSLTQYWYLFVSMTIILIVAFLTFKKTDDGRRFLDSLKIRIPGVKKTNVKIITARFSRTLSTLLSSGIPLIQSIEVVGRIVGNKVVQDRLNLAAEDISKGVSLSKTIKDIDIFPPMVDSMIKIGEESGSLDEILYKTADFYDDEVEVALQKMTTLLEPLLLVFMAIVIGFIVIAMAMPMFDMVNTIEI